MTCYTRIWLSKNEDGETWNYVLKEIGQASSYREAQERFGKLVIVGG